MKRVLFISSTGGHLSELLRLEPLFNEYDYYIVTEKDLSTLNLKDKYGNKVFYVPYCTRSKIVSYLFLYSFLILKTIYLFIKIKPEIIVTTGSHTVVPMCYIGKFFGRKIIYIETYANINKKTLTGRMIYPIANLFIVQWKSMLKLYSKAVFVGKMEAE